MFDNSSFMSAACRDAFHIIFIVVGEVGAEVYAGLLRQFFRFFYRFFCALQDLYDPIFGSLLECVACGDSSSFPVFQYEIDAIFEIGFVVPAAIQEYGIFESAVFLELFFESFHGR